MDTKVLGAWLKAGGLDKGILYPTSAGTPQGGIISPVLCDMTLDGLENVVKSAVPSRTNPHISRLFDCERGYRAISRRYLGSRARCASAHLRPLAFANALILHNLHPLVSNNREICGLGGNSRTLSARYGYDLSRNADQICPSYRTNLTCPGSVPEAIIAFLASHGFEDAVRNAVSLGGDADTRAAIAGAIAEPFCGRLPYDIVLEVGKRLNAAFRTIIANFSARDGTAVMAVQVARALG